MGVHFLAAGTTTTRNRTRTLDRAHSVDDLALMVPPDVADRLRTAFPNGEGVYLWGARGGSWGQLRQVQPGDYVVDVANREVRQVFRFVFAFRLPDYRLLNHVGWDDEVPLHRRRPYAFAYFLRDPQPTAHTDKRWFQRALGFPSPSWLIGQTYVPDAVLAQALVRTGLPTVEALLGIAPRARGAERI